MGDILRTNHLNRKQNGNIVLADFGRIFPHRVKDIEITMNITRMCIPDMQEDAAAKMGAILF